jgi:hypothetical protein
VDGLGEPAGEHAGPHRQRDLRDHLPGPGRDDRRAEDPAAAEAAGEAAGAGDDPDEALGSARR